MSVMNTAKPTVLPPLPSPSSLTATAPRKTRTSAARSIRRNSGKIAAMANRLSLENLPLEVIHQIFSLLCPPDLTSLRLTSHSLHPLATSNPHWRHLFNHSLLPAHAALLDVVTVPENAWSFSCVPDGWFRAYTALVRVSREEWLWSEEQLKGSRWMVFFKAFLKEGGARMDDPGWHALVELREDCTCHPLEGLPLNVSSWYVDARKSLRFSGYPPNVPSRDSFTWCRIMQHVSVLMVTDSPEFLAVLRTLNTTILNEAVAAGTLEVAKRTEREKELQEAAEDVLEKRKVGFSERVKRLHLLRSERQDRRCRGEIEDEEIEDRRVRVVDEESESDSDSDAEEWSDGESGEGCALFQHFQQQQSLGLAAETEEEADEEQG